MKVAPEIEKMLHWLTRGGPLLPDGSVLSWVNTRHPGYGYPEAAALLLRLLATEVPGVVQRTAIANRLVQSISPCGGVGKNGREYVFDAAMALSALIALRCTAGTSWTRAHLGGCSHSCRIASNENWRPAGHLRRMPTTGAQAMAVTSSRR